MPDWTLCPTCGKPKMYVCRRREGRCCATVIYCLFALHPDCQARSPSPCFYPLPTDLHRIGGLLPLLRLLLRCHDTVLALHKPHLTGPFSLPLPPFLLTDLHKIGGLLPLLGLLRCHDTVLALHKPHLTGPFSLPLPPFLLTDLHKIGGLPPLLGLLRCRHPSLRWRAAEVVATCVANNPPVQQWFLDGGVLPALMGLLQDTDATCRTKVRRTVHGAGGSGCAACSVGALSGLGWNPRDEGNV